MRFLTIAILHAFLCVLLAPTAWASDILVVVDSSGSMQQKTPDGTTRIDAAKAALLKLPPTLKGHEVGVVLFGHRNPRSCSDIELRLPIGPFSEPEYKLTVAALNPRGATPIARSLLLSRDTLLRRESDTQKAVILVTDGNETCGGDPVAAAKALRDIGVNVRVHVVGFGVDKKQEVQLRAIAKAGGGMFLLARDAADLNKALPKIVSTALRSTKIEELERKVFAKDTFEAEGLGDDWIVIREDQERCAAVDGELLIVTQHTGDTNNSPHIGDWHDNAKTKNIVQWKHSISANDFEVSVDLTFQISALGQGAALQLRKDDHHAVELAFVAHPYGNNIERKFSMCKTLGDQVASTYSALATGLAEGPERMTLKIVKRGIVFTGYVRIEDSKTGKLVWREVGMQAVPGFDQVHPALKAANGWENRAEATAAFDNFVVIENVLKRTVTDRQPKNAKYFTVFDNPEKFQTEFKVLDEAKTHHGLNGGLNIVSQFGTPGDEKNPLKNIVLLKQPLPSGNYEIQVQARTRLTNQNSDVGVVLFQDHKTALFAGHAAYGGGGYNYDPQFQFDKVLGGKRTSVRKLVQHVQGKEITVIFKITKQGRKYTTSVYAPTDKKGKMAWLPLGEQTLLKFRPQLGFYARNWSAGTYGRGPAHEVNICFERVVVRSIK